MSQAFIDLFYLLAAALFILGLRDMSHPRRVGRGNLFGSAGMLVAIVVTLLDQRIVSFEIIVVGLVSGALIGAVMAYRVPMTGIPQVVAIFNGFGGGASALAVGAALEEALKGGFVEEISVQFTISSVGAGLIGGVALTGSAIAFGKLQGLIPERPILLPGRHAINVALALVCLGLSVWLVLGPDLLGAVLAPGAHGCRPRHLPRATHRRRRHAGGDRPAQLVLRTGRRGARVGAEQQRAHHCRLPGRHRRVHSHRPDVPGDEPLGDQRDIRRRGCRGSHHDRDR